MADKIDNHIFQAGGKNGTGQAENDRAIFLAEHRVVNLCGPAEIARGEGHLAHRFDQWDDVVLFDIDVLDNFDEEIGFFRFHIAVIPNGVRDLTYEVLVTQLLSVINQRLRDPSLRSG